MIKRSISFSWIHLHIETSVINSIPLYQINFGLNYFLCNYELDLDIYSDYIMSKYFNISATSEILTNPFSH